VNHRLLSALLLAAILVGVAQLDPPGLAIPEETLDIAATMKGPAQTADHLDSFFLVLLGSMLIVLSGARWTAHLPSQRQVPSRRIDLNAPSEGSSIQAFATFGQPHGRLEPQEQALGDSPHARVPAGNQSLLPPERRGTTIVVNRGHDGFSTVSRLIQRAARVAYSLVVMNYAAVAGLVFLICRRPLWKENATASHHLVLPSRAASSEQRSSPGRVVHGSDIHGLGRTGEA
jgi:hypothetical protein